MLFKLIKSACAKEKKRYNKNELDEKSFSASQIHSLLQWKKLRFVNKVNVK